MPTTLTIIDNLTGESEQFQRETDLSKCFLEEIFQEFGLELPQDCFVNRYGSCVVLREREGFTTFKIEHS